MLYIIFQKTNCVILLYIILYLTSPKFIKIPLTPIPPSGEASYYAYPAYYQSEGFARMGYLIPVHDEMGAGGAWEILPECHNWARARPGL